MKQAQVLSKSQLKTVMSIAKTSGKHSERNCLAIALSYYAGLRVKEVASLLISDIYTEEGQVKQFIFLSADKSKGYSRTIVINKHLASKLKQYAQLIDITKRDKPLIASQKGKFKPNALCQLFGRLYKAAGLENCTSHSGRRSFITNLAHKGVSAKVLMTLAGHQHLSTTQRYIDVNDNMLAAAVELI
jgi:integrase/recombinase XerD